MNRKEFEQFLLDKFTTVFCCSFTREMVSNILDFAEGIADESEQYNFLGKMIPQIPERELRKVHL